MKWREACTRSHSWSNPLVGVGYSFNFRFTSAHTCFTGFKSGDWGGQVSTSKFCMDNRCLTNIIVCLISLSCWNMTWEGVGMVRFRYLHDPILNFFAKIRVIWLLWNDFPKFVDLMIDSVWRVNVAFGWGPAGHIWLHAPLEGLWPDGMVLDTSCGLAQFPGHGSWLVCEVALSSFKVELPMRAAMMRFPAWVPPVPLLVGWATPCLSYPLCLPASSSWVLTFITMSFSYIYCHHLSTHCHLTCNLSR